MPWKLPGSGIIDFLLCAVSSKNMIKEVLPLLGPLLSEVVSVLALGLRTSQQNHLVECDKGHHTHP